jgi:hypothetical protein
MTLATIPFSAPAQLLAQVATGDLVRYGTILKDAGTGRIVAHLQETGAFSNAMTQVLPTAGEMISSGGPVSMLMEGVSIYQNHKAGRKIDALTEMVSSLETLNLVGAVASVAGIGVTVASTVVLMQRISVVDENLKSLTERVEGIPREIRDQQVSDLLTEVDTQLQMLEEAPLRVSAGGMKADMEAAEKTLHSTFNALHNMAIQSARLPVLDMELLRTLLSGLAVAGAAQIKSLVWLNDLAVAEKRTIKQAEQLFQLSQLLPQDVLMNRTESNPQLAVHLGAELADLRATAATRPALLENLQRLEIDGPRYLAEMEERDDVAVLALASG